MLTAFRSDEPPAVAFAHYPAEGFMRRPRGITIAILLLGHLVLPTVGLAQVGQRPDFPGTASRFELPSTRLADAAVQQPTAPKPSLPRRKLLRNALIGAAIGAALTAAMGTAGDCGACGSDRAKGVLAGAMYGAMVGAAIRIHPSRRPVVTIGTR